ncbi:MAG TPA: hypothetical protein VL094_10335 [Sphingomonadaceae bacterium]|nr:hypothetical protein [Sphingomonadaceae bacterium]
MSMYRRPRGHPVLMLLLVLGGWIAVRGAFWEAPHLQAAQAFGVPAMAQPALAAVPPSFTQPVAQGPSAASPAIVYVVSEPDLGLLERIIMQLGLARTGPAMATQGIAAGSGWPVQQAQSAGGGILPWSYSLAGGSGSIQDGARAAPAAPAPQSAPFQPAALSAEASPLRRWAADGWAMLRRDTTSALTSGKGSYGQSQAGTVLRYRVIPTSSYRPELYARVSQALGGAQEVEGALGASVRPLAGVPVTLAAEGRVTQVNGRTSIRPAAYAVAQLPRVELPLGVRAEAYAQGGYVWGDYSSAFVDGQARLERPAVNIGKLEVNAGVGAWGGAQKGAARLDVGPTASVYVPVGKMGSRVSVDWRLRVAGEAEPSDGPAVTLSTGF